MKPSVKTITPEPPEVSAFAQQFQSIAALDMDSLPARQLTLNLTDIEKPRGMKVADEGVQRPLLPVTSPDTDAVLATLKRYSEAWSAKDVSKITALRPGLGERKVKKELSSVRFIAMRIRPLSSPKIQGDHAAVECIHEVNQTFNDGIARAHPGIKMTYALIRRGGNWFIESSTSQAER